MQQNAKHRVLLMVQLIATIGILAWVPTNIGKTLALLTLWLLTFPSLTTREIVFFGCACALFSAMDAASLRQGVFEFNHPDLLGMPIYEFFMWGFYLLHTLRMLDGPAPRGNAKWSWMLAALFAVCFSVISNQGILLVATGMLLTTALLIYHERLDIAYCVYMVFLGMVIEFTGVWADQWHYPGHPPGGVPLWFVTLWGGVGLFLRRIILPLVSNSHAYRITG